MPGMFRPGLTMRRVVHLQRAGGDREVARGGETERDPPNWRDTANKTAIQSSGVGSKAQKSGPVSG